MTDQAFPFPAGQTLVSTTDTKGRILYCNPAFIEVSGYSKEELLGQPHNLIRHPDMPEEAFRDMWDTIRSGHPWSAPVKNRRKDGSFYWVMANVTPLLNDSGQCEGYMSVRTEPRREQVQEAEVLYARMRLERGEGRQVLAFKAGRLINLSPWGRLRERLRFGLPSQLLAALLAVAVRRSLVERAVGILAVDGIKVSDRARELLSRCEAGTLTFDEARAEVIARAQAIADAKNVKND